MILSANTIAHSRNVIKAQRIARIQASIEAQIAYEEAIIEAEREADRLEELALKAQDFAYDAHQPVY